MLTRERRGRMRLEIGVAVFVVVMVLQTLQPQFPPSSDQQAVTTAEFNLAMLRAVIESYRADHAGRWPRADEITGTIPELLPTTVGEHPSTVGRAPGAYLDRMPENPLTGSRVVRVTQLPRVTAADVSERNGGWLYNDTTGQVWLDSNPGYAW